MGALNLFNLQASDFLSGPECGYVTPDNPYVELAHSLVYTTPQLQPGDIRVNERQPVNAQGIFIVTGIQILTPPSAGGGKGGGLGPPLVLYVRFQWPNGRYTSNIRLDHTVCFAPYKDFSPSATSNAGIFINRPIRIEPVACLPGTEIGIELENKASLAQPSFSAMIEFRGRLRRFLKK